eukprot:TRINITY_DN4735_c0_g1_i1.p1 TRINITY_DN4735_c0_g1~~TRINITY_DN4735_c0_g1_i1.p1  ORF type:complete len:339 (+),score=81.41 TRINITY_DN4735_c0_g1_i1:82-1017(+)
MKDQREMSNDDSEYHYNNSTLHSPSQLTILPVLQPYLIPKTGIEISSHPIGTGSSGVVFKAVWMNKTVAVKQMKTQKIDQLMKLQQECRVMKEISPHNNVVQLLGLMENPLSLVTEYCLFGSLDTYILGKEPINMTKRFGILCDVAQGMVHLQSHNIVHRDLAARNCLLAEGFVIKVSDFGMSRLMDPEEEGSMFTNSTIGPLKWMAPELFTARKYSFRTDVYSFGVLCIEVLTRKRPYPDIKMEEFAVNVIVKDLTSTLPSYIPSSVPITIKEMITDCLSKDPSKRPTFSDIVQVLQDSRSIHDNSTVDP